MKTLIRKMSLYLPVGGLLVILGAGTLSAFVLLSPARTWDSDPTIIVDQRGLASVNDGDGGANRTVNAIVSSSAWNGTLAGTVINAQKGDVTGISQGDGTPMLTFTDPFGACTGSCLAATFINQYSQRSDGSYRITDADVITNTSHQWTSQGEDPNGSGCSNEYYVEGVMVHEAGHVLGVDHSSVSGATMQPTTGACNNSWATTETDDREAILCLYRQTRLNGSGSTFAGRRFADLIWDVRCPTTASANVDIFRDGVKIVTTSNGGGYSEMFFSSATSANYWVCKAGSTTWYETATCSTVITVFFE